MTFMLNSEPGPIIEVTSHGAYAKVQVIEYSGRMPWNRAQRLADEYIAELFGDARYKVHYLCINRSFRSRSFHFEVIWTGEYRKQLLQLPVGKFYSDDTRKDSVPGHSFKPTGA